MIDLERQLQQYVETSFDQVPSTAVDTVLDGHSHRTRRDRWSVAVAAAVVVVALVVAITVVAIERDRSPQVGAGARRDAAVTDTDPVPSGAGEWTVDLGGEIPYAPVVVDGAVIVATMADDFSQSTVVALEVAGSDVDQRVGAGRWAVDPGAPVIATPVAAAGTVLVRLADDRLVALDARDGSERWAVATGSGPGEAIRPPVVHDRTVYVGSPDGLLQAVELDSGDERWRLRLDGAVLAPPTPAGDDLLVATSALPVGSGAGRVYVVGPTGEVMSSYEITEPVFVPPVGDRTRVVIGGDRGTLLIGRDVAHELGGWLAAPVVTNDVVAAVSATGVVRAYAADDPVREVWSVDLGANQGPELVRRGDVLIAVAGGLDALDPRTGDRRWRANLPEAFLGTSDDSDLLVAVSRTRGSLAVVDVRDGSFVVDFTLRDTPSGAVLRDRTLVWTGAGGVVTAARLAASK